MFTVHSRGVFTQDKSSYFSNSKVYGEKMGPGKSVDYEGVFTNQGCSLESIPDRREPYRRVPLGRVHLDERRLDEVQ